MCKIGETFIFSVEDKIAQGYKEIEKTFASSMVDVKIKQEAFQRFLKGLRIQV